MSETMRQTSAKFKRLLFGRSPSLARRALRFFLLFAVLSVVWFVPWVFTVPLGLSLTRPYEADGASRYLALVGPVAGALGMAEWTGEKAIPPACFAAVVAAEDTRFYDHSGVDWESMESAWNFNQKSQETISSSRSAAKKRSRATKAAKVRGASTITQQLVKNLYLSRDRSYLRKVREITGALLLEPFVSKETILTWYLNVVEFGPRLYGIEAAAQHYFGKAAKDLRPSQCVSLSVILPSPNTWNASLESHTYSPFFSKRYTVIARRMQVLGHVAATVLREVRSDGPFFFEQPPSAPVDPSDIELPVPPADPETDGLTEEAAGPPDVGGPAAGAASPSPVPDSGQQEVAPPEPDTQVDESGEPAENQ